jgi:bile acid-coenzyme A ligase
MLRTDMPLAIVSPASPRLEQTAVTQALLRCGYSVVGVHEGRVAQVASAPATRSGGPASMTLAGESVLLATGGSAGRPKLVVDARVRTVARRPRGARPSAIMNWSPGQCQMIIGPLHHAASLTFFIEGLCDGNTLVVPASFDPAIVLGGIVQWRIEWLQTTPYHLRHLAIAARKNHSDLSGVCGLLHMAAPCSAQLKRYWIEALGPERIFEIYASTEGIGMTLARGDEWVRRPGTVGKGFFTDIRIMDNNLHPLPPGAVGDIFMRSGTGLGNPYLEPADQIRGTADGFASVGDTGWLDGDGYLYLAARQLSRIQVGGETVDPGEIESVLLGHPDGLDAAVAGVADDRLGESLVALVISAGARDAKAVKQYLRERMERPKVPRTVRFVEQLPYTDAGKLDRGRLAEVAARPELC